MKLIIGLGNPGNHYAKTRHNVGFMAVNLLSRNKPLDCEDWKINKKFNAETAVSGDRKILLFKPLTFMNESGKAVKAALNFFKLQPEDIFVFHDDLDIPFGSYKIQKRRGSAGHNGIESLFAHLGTRDFTRIRIGIANDERHKNGADFVLSPFTAKEQKFLPATLTRAAEELFKKHVF